MIPMKPTPLSQLAVVSAGQGAPKDDEFSASGVPFVRAGSLESLLLGKNESELELVSPVTAKMRKLKTYPKGTILFAKSGMSATKDRVYVLQNPAHVVSHLATLIPKKGANVDYLRLALKRFPPSTLIKDPSYPAIGLAEIENFEIPVPEDFDDQIRIAHLLGKVEGLITQRKQHLQQLDDLLKSVFLEMFGPTNPDYEIWPLVEIRELAANHKGAMRTGPFGSNLLHSEFTQSGDVAVLGIDNAVQNRFAWGERRFISNNKYQELQSYRIFPGDVIVTIMGTIGRSAVIPDDIPVAINTKHLAAITLNKEIANPLFLSYSIHSSPFILNQFKSKDRGAIMSGLNLGLIKEIKLKRPPIELQNQFAAIHKKIDRVKSSYQQSIVDLENLYGALSQKGFKGELDLSRVPLPNIQAQEENAVATEPLEPPEEQAQAIHLPDTDNLLDAIESAEGRQQLISHWLEAYRSQLGNVPFSVKRFLETAQTRLAELHPDNDFELGASDYEHIKEWVFKALNTGLLTQEIDSENNQIFLKARSAEWGSW